MKTYHHLVSDIQISQKLSIADIFGHQELNSEDSMARSVLYRYLHPQVQLSYKGNFLITLFNQALCRVEEKAQRCPSRWVKGLAKIIKSNIVVLWFCTKFWTHLDTIVVQRTAGSTVGPTVLYSRLTGLQVIIWKTKFSQGCAC